MSRLPLALAYALPAAVVAWGLTAELGLQPLPNAVIAGLLGAYAAVEQVDRMERSLREERTDVSDGEGAHGDYA